MTAPVPDDEAARLEALRRCDVLDARPVPPLDDIVRLAAQVCGTPSAFISLIDSDRQWFKSRVGWDAPDSPRGASVCAHTIRQPDGELIVEDATRDARLRDNAFVTQSSTQVRFYAGMSLVTDDGHVLGTLCVVDRVPRTLTASQLAALRTLRRSAVAELELRRARAAPQPSGQPAGDSRLRRLIDGLGPGMLVGLMTPDGVLIEANAPALALAGLAPADVIGKPFEQTYWWSYSADVQERLRAAIATAATGVPVHYDCQIRASEDRLVWIAFSLQPVHDATGRVALLVPSAVDIDARRRAEEALRLSEQRFRLAAATGDIWEADLRSGKGRISSHFKRLLGFDEHEMEDQVAAFKARLHPDDVEPWRRAIQDHIVRHTPYLLEFRARSKSGEYRWFITRGQATWDAEGQGTYMAGTVFEITERKRAEERLRASEDRLRRIMDNMYPFVGLFSLEGCVLEVNRTALEVADLRHEEVIGRQCADIVWFNYSTAAQARLRAALARAGAGEVVRYDELVQVSGGKFIDIDLMFSPLRDDDGRVQQIVGSATDITARKAAESERQAQAEDLRRLSRRVMEIAETERRALSRELHDRIGQNLATLNLNLKLVRGRVAAHAPAEVLARIDAAHQLIEATTRDARDLMAELNPPALEDFGLLAALRAHVDSLASHSSTRIAVAGEECVPRLPPPVELALFRIAQEALANAAKHSQASRVAVTLAATRARVTLTIVDDGTGIDAGGAARKAGSWGLKIMRERATAIGAVLQVTSAPGRGTSIAVEFARAAA